MGTTEETRLQQFLDAFTPAVRAEAVLCRQQMQALLPGAVELVYDNHAALVISYAPREKTSEAVASLAIMPKWVTLCFLLGASTLPDPTARLTGSGKVARSVRLASAVTLQEPDIRALIAAVAARAPHPFDASQPTRTVIKSVSAKQRPRRPSV